MRKLDVFDIKCADVPHIKYEARKLVNSALDDLELMYEKVMCKVCTIESDAFFDFVSLLDKLYTIFDFMHNTSMLNRFVYEEYMKILYDMNEAVEDKVDYEEVVFESLTDEYC